MNPSESSKIAIDSDSWHFKLRILIIRLIKGYRISASYVEGITLRQYLSPFFLALLLLPFVLYGLFQGIYTFVSLTLLVAGNSRAQFFYHDLGLLGMAIGVIGAIFTLRFAAQLWLVMEDDIEEFFDNLLKKGKKITVKDKKAPYE